MTVPGIGPIISSAMVAAIGTGDVFAKGRDFGAWLGLVPKQISTGDRTILGSGSVLRLNIFGTRKRLKQELEKKLESRALTVAQQRNDGK